MKIKEALYYTLSELKKANIGSYFLDALIILKIALKKDEVFILSNLEKKLSDKQFQKIKELIIKRKKKYPMAYITKHKEFYGFDFYVDERVLIPRPETELLIEKTLKIVSNMENPTIVDIGTGSGCIAITLSKLLNNAKIVASDISKEALYIAKINKKRLEAKISLICADKLSFLKQADIVVSNPPYVSYEEYSKLPDDVKHEPKNALLSEGGIDFTSELISQAKNVTTFLILEIDPNQSNFISKLDNCIDIEKDLSGNDRIAVFKFK